MSQYLTRYRPLGLRHAGDVDLSTNVHLRRLLGLVAQRLNYVPQRIADPAPCCAS